MVAHSSDPPRWRIAQYKDGWIIEKWIKELGEYHPVPVIFETKEEAEEMLSTLR